MASQRKAIRSGNNLGELLTRSTEAQKHSMHMYEIKRHIHSFFEIQKPFVSLNVPIQLLSPRDDEPVGIGLLFPPFWISAAEGSTSHSHKSPAPPSTMVYNFDTNAETGRLFTAELAIS